MLKNYFTIAFRNLLKNKLYTAINLIGLTIGVTAGILIFLLIQQELSFDNFHSQADRVYRVVRYEQWEGKDRTTSASTPMKLATAIRDNISHADKVSRLIDAMYLAKVEGGDGFSQGVHFVGPEFLEIFDFDLLEGSNFRASQKQNIILTEEAAQRYFPNRQAVGQTLLLQLDEEFHPFTVHGVVANPPVNSSIRFEILVPDENLDLVYDEQARNSWFQVYGETYLLAKPGTEIPDVRNAMRSMMQVALGERAAEVDYDFIIQPLEDIHLNADIPVSVAEVTNPQLLWILGGVAALIILIAGINFTTLAIGRSVSRSKEVGVRKSMGAGFGQLFTQFMAESFTVTLLALGVGLLVAEAFLPTFNRLLQNQLVLNYSAYQLAVVLLLIILMTLLSGAYPAFFLSQLRPATVMRGTGPKLGKEGLRKGLLAFQFFISITLISCTLIMYNQMQKIRDFNLGIDQESILEITMPPQASIRAGFEYAERMKNSLSAHEDVLEVGTAISTYGDKSWMQVGYENEERESVIFNLNIVDEGFAKVLDLEFLEGRNFSADVPADRMSGFLLNEAMADMLGWDDPVGKSLPGKNFGENRAIGLVKGFHFESLYNPIAPAIMVMDPEHFFSGINHIVINQELRQTLLVKYQTVDLQATLSDFQALWRNNYGTDPFEYAFFDETIMNNYAQDSRMSRLITLAAIIAIVISGMGLFALASLSIASRVKEIGIRKVLGASTVELSVLFNREFLKIIVIGMALSIPTAYLLMERWMQQFAVRDPLGPWVFVLALLLGCLFSVLIVTFKTVQTSLANPVKSLKTE